MNIKPQIQNEPVRAGNLVSGLIVAGLAAMASYGVDVSPELRAFLLLLIASLPSLIGEVQRRYTSPARKLTELEEQNRHLHNVLADLQTENTALGMTVDNAMRGYQVGGEADSLGPAQLENDGH